MIECLFMRAFGQITDIVVCASRLAHGREDFIAVLLGFPLNIRQGGKEAGFDLGRIERIAL